jgi:hypothetical protein
MVELKSWDIGKIRHIQQRRQPELFMESGAASCRAPDGVRQSLGGPA